MIILYMKKPRRYVTSNASSLRLGLGQFQGLSNLSLQPFDPFMANRTDPAAKSIRGTNPQNLVEKILRSKIYQNTYWKEQCFGLTAETLVDKAMELDHLGGTYGGNRKPTPFMCLVMKMLQIQPEKDIVVEFIKNDDYKYVPLILLSICYF